MEISLSFNPSKDAHAHVSNVVDAVFGVQQSPNAQSGAQSVQTALNTPVSAAPTSPPVSPTVVSTTAPLSSPAAAGVAEFPNPTTAPTQVVSATHATASPAGVELDKNGIPWDVRIHSGGVEADGAHKKNKDGSWAKRKGVSDLDVSTITKELQNLMAAQIGTGNPPAGLPVGGVVGHPSNVPHQEAVPLPNDPNNFVISPGTTAPLGQPAPQQPAPVVTAPVGQPTPQSGAPVAAFPDAPQQLSGAPVLAPNVAPMPVPMPAAPAAPTDFNSLAVWLAPNLEESGGKLSRAHVEHFCRQCNIVNAQGEGDFSLVANRPDAVVWLHQAFVAQIAAAQ